MVFVNICRSYLKEEQNAFRCVEIQQKQIWSSEGGSSVELPTTPTK